MFLYYLYHLENIYSVIMLTYTTFVMFLVWTLQIRFRFFKTWFLEEHAIVSIVTKLLTFNKQSQYSSVEFYHNTRYSSIYEHMRELHVVRVSSRLVSWDFLLKERLFTTCFLMEKVKLFHALFLFSYFSTDIVVVVAILYAFHFRQVNTNI